MPFPLEDMKLLVRLTVPIVLAQLAQTSMGFVDTVVAGKAGTLDLAAVALGASFWIPILLLGQGVVLAVMPQVARLHGYAGPAHDEDKHAGPPGKVDGLRIESGPSGSRAGIGHELRQGVWLALLLAIPLMAFLWALTLVLPRLGYQPELSHMAARYLRACMWGLPGYMIFVALRSGLDGLGQVRMAMIAAFLGLGLNIVGNIGFVLGKWGLPAYGGVGTGIATAIVCWFMAVVMLLLCLRMPDVRGWLAVANWTRPHWLTMRRTTVVGLPGAVATVCEVSMFSAINALIAFLGPMALAANQIAASFSGLVFMLPLSLSIAVTILTGRRIGEGNPAGARSSARAGRWLGLGLAAVTALGMFRLRDQIPYLFTQDPIVAASASTLLIIAACYQFPDALQVISAGALRAYDDTRAIFVIALFTYWVVGLPLGYLLGRTHLLFPPMGARGFWIAITVGLALASVLFSLRLRQRERRHEQHMRLEKGPGVCGCG